MLVWGYLYSITLLIFGILPCKNSLSQFYVISVIHCPACEVLCEILRGQEVETAFHCPVPWVTGLFASVALSRCSVSIYCSAGAGTMGQMAHCDAAVYKLWSLSGLDMQHSISTSELVQLTTNIPMVQCHSDLIADKVMLPLWLWNGGMVMH